VKSLKVMIEDFQPLPVRRKRNQEKWDTRSLESGGVTAKNQIKPLGNFLNPRNTRQKEVL
jgi:hypothetical protein